jgi:3-oxoacyl-[acyl-carrier-protein] synthase III
MPSFCITGIGSHVPATILTNDDLSRMVATGATEAARGNGSGM